MTPEQEQALRTARLLVDMGHQLEVVIENPLIPAEHRDFIVETMQEEQNYLLLPTTTISENPDRPDWLMGLDRSTWHYWPTLRQFLINVKGWTLPVVRSLDDASDKILKELEPPETEQFDIRGLVIGYVQSGKTANFTALIAKAADAGYRLFIVLSGMDNGLRRQTNIRLKKELVGFSPRRPGAVSLPPAGRRWHEFTTDAIDGDFRPGFANHAALQGTQPVLLVVKKNNDVLLRLIDWLEDAPEDVRRSLPLLVVDDEADQASIDTRGTYISEDDGEADDDGDDYTPPSVINGHIRNILQLFGRRAYVGYTATPYANTLIPHDSSHSDFGADLYPKDFIIALPKPRGYFGTEAIFGMADTGGEEQSPGLDIIRLVTDEDVDGMEDDGEVPSLRLALLDFVLSGAARAQRGQEDMPCTMLIHTSRLQDEHAVLRGMVEEVYSDLRDSWRYHRGHGIREVLSTRWDEEFRPLTQSLHMDLDVEFGEVESHIGTFFEAVQIKEVNSNTGEVLDYDNEPSMKAIAIGGNRLSRGLTLEGLMVSFFVRRSPTYDTLMQMGRWFGYRGGYEDLTRIWTTEELGSWFRDLSFVEHRLREDIGIYESSGMRPKDLGMRILCHPAMQVTSRLKRRHIGSPRLLSASYELALEQTFKFPFNRPALLAEQADTNLAVVREFVGRLGPNNSDFPADKGPLWTGARPEDVLWFLEEFQVDEGLSNMNLPLIRAYIERMRAAEELTEWTVAIQGRVTERADLGAADWELPTGPVNQILRSRLRGSESLGVITGSGDEETGFDKDALERLQGLIDAAVAEGKTKSRNSAARAVRPSSNGLIMLFPISKNSGGDLAGNSTGRIPLYADPDGEHARDLIGLAISFPKSDQPQSVEAYLEGTVGWRPVEE
jgi:Z1 domain